MMVTDTVYLALPEALLKSADHPLLHRELAWQREDIAYVKSSRPMQDLRAHAAKQGAELARDLERLLLDG
jgi:hypothetical protein